MKTQEAFDQFKAAPSDATAKAYFKAIADDGLASEPFDLENLLLGLNQFEHDYYELMGEENNE